MRQPPLRSALVLAIALAAGGGPTSIRAQEALVDNPRALDAPDDGITILHEGTGAVSVPVDALTEPRALRAELAPSDGAAPNGASAQPSQSGNTPICVWTALTMDTATPGALTASDCRWGQLVGPDQAFQIDPSRVDIYTVDLTERSLLTITVTPSFNAQINLRDAGFSRLRDVQAPAGAPAVLRATLPAGRYEVAVRPALPGGSTGGDYTIQAAAEPTPSGSPCEPGTLAPGDVVNGTLEPGCALFDWLPDQAFDNAAQLYELVLDEPGDLSLTLTSSTGTFVPLLALMVEDRSRDLAVDASGGAGDPSPDASALSLSLPAGRYWVLAAAARPGGTGAFTLASQFDSAAGKCAILPSADAALPLDTPITVTLVADGCRTSHLNADLLRDAPAKVYRVFIPQQGNVTFGLQANGFEPLIQMLNTKFERIPGVGTRALGNGGLLSIGVPRDFLIIVQGADGETGDVELTVGFEELGDPCQIQAIAATGSASGTLDGTDCNLEDWIGYADASKVDVYPVYVPSRGRLRIAFASTVIQPYLWLLGRDRIFTIQADEVSSGMATIELVLDAGHYLIGTNSLEPAIGDYTLTTTFTPEARPVSCPASPLPVPSIIDAELSGTECRVFDTDPTSGWPSPVDRYLVRLTTYGELNLVASSEAFVLRMALFDAATGMNVVIVTGDDLPAETTASLRLPPGDYYLEIDDAFLYYPESGDYHLEVSHQPLPDPRPCVEIDLGTLPGTLLDPGYAVDGELSDTDCVVGDFPRTTFSQFPVDTYTVTVPQRGTITIDLRSDDFDPRLDVLDWAYNLILQNDDADGIFDTNSHIESAIGPGLYRIQALADDLAYGPYELDVIFRPENYIPPGEVTATPTATGGATTGTPTPTSTGGPTEVTPTPGTPGTTVAWIFLPWAGKGAHIVP